jgi:hypothetical protein
MVDRPNARKRALTIFERDRKANVAVRVVTESRKGVVR